MFELKFDSKKIKNYKFKCSRQDEIIQNIENIVSRVKGNVPLNREKGLDSSVIDEDFDYAQASLVALIMEEIEREEERFEVNEVRFEKNEQQYGRLIVVVKGVIKDE